jgi:hypothetical protein
MRFLSVDPLAADYADWSAYHYAANNPIIITDPTGREWSETNKELAEMYGVFGRGQGTDRDALRLLEEDNNDVCPECLTWLLRSYDSFKEYKFTWFLDYEVSLGAQFGAEVNILTPLSGNTKLGRGSKLFGLGGHASLFKASLFGNKVGVLGLSNAKPIYSPFGYDYKAKTVPVTQSIGFNFLGLGGEYEKSFLAYLSGGGYSKLGSNSEASLNLGASEINALSYPPVQSYLLKTGVDFKLLLGLKFEVNFGFTKQ